MSRWRLRHPNAKLLTAWINGGETELDDHIESCEKCAGRIESLDEASSVALASALGQLLTAPPDLGPRLHRGISQKMEGKGDYALLGDLLTLPFQTARVLSQGSDIDG